MLAVTWAAVLPNGLAHLKGELARWPRVIAAANIKADYRTREIA